LLWIGSLEYLGSLGDQFDELATELPRRAPVWRVSWTRFRSTNETESGETCSTTVTGMRLSCSMMRPTRA